MSHPSLFAQWAAKSRGKPLPETHREAHTTTDATDSPTEVVVDHVPENVGVSHAGMDGINDAFKSIPTLDWSTLATKSDGIDPSVSTAWTGDLPKVPDDAKIPDDVAEWRFGFDGTVVPPTADFPTQSGLYHHGKDQQLPGYTLSELLRLSRSSNPAQRSQSLELLNRILRAADPLTPIQQHLYKCDAATAISSGIAASMGIGAGHGPQAHLTSLIAGLQCLISLLRPDLIVRQIEGRLDGYRGCDVISSSSKQVVDANLAAMLWSFISDDISPVIRDMCFELLVPCLMDTGVVATIVLNSPDNIVKMLNIRTIFAIYDVFIACAVDKRVAKIVAKYSELVISCLSNSNISRVSYAILRLFAHYGLPVDIKCLDTNRHEVLRLFADMRIDSGIVPSSQNLPKLATFLHLTASLQRDIDLDEIIASLISCKRDEFWLDCVWGVFRCGSSDPTLISALIDCGSQRDLGRVLACGIEKYATSDEFIVSIAVRALSLLMGGDELLLSELLATLCRHMGVLYSEDYSGLLDLYKYHLVDDDELRQSRDRWQYSATSLLVRDTTKSLPLQHTWLWGPVCGWENHDEHTPTIRFLERVEEVMNRSAQHDWWLQYITSGEKAFIQHPTLAETDRLLDAIMIQPDPTHSLSVPNIEHALISTPMPTPVPTPIPTPMPTPIAIIQEMCTVYSADAYGNGCFGRVLIALLAMEYSVEYRKMIWQELWAIIRLLSHHTYPPPISLSSLLTPTESDSSLLRSYMRFCRWYMSKNGSSDEVSDSFFGWFASVPLYHLGKSGAMRGDMSKDMSILLDRVVASIDAE